MCWVGGQEDVCPVRPIWFKGARMKLLLLLDGVLLIGALLAALGLAVTAFVRNEPSYAGQAAIILLLGAIWQQVSKGPNIFLSK